MNRLAEIFRQLGAEDPEEWAGSQEREGIPQLHRFLFLRSAWEGAIDPQNSEWVDRLLSSDDLCLPRIEARDALTRLLGSGKDRADLTSLIR